MAEKLDPNEIVTLEDLALSNMWEMTLSPEDAASTVLPPRSPKTPVNNLDTFFACLLPAFGCVSPT